MKNKKINIFISITLTLLLLTSCASIIVLDVDYSIDKIIEGDDIAQIDIIPYFGQDNILTGWSNAKGTRGYVVNINNISNNTIKINWNNSSITYNNTSSLIFQEGQKYIDSNSPMPPTILPMNSKISKQIYSSNQVDYVRGKYGGWEMNVIPSFDTTVTICIEHNGTETYYIFIIKGSEKIIQDT
jgi:hypothetical protein